MPENQPLKSVTVTDIHRVTGISRATFYRLFDLLYRYTEKNFRIMDST